MSISAQIGTQSDLIPGNTLDLARRLFRDRGWPLAFGVSAMLLMTLLVWLSAKPSLRGSYVPLGHDHWIDVFYVALEPLVLLGLTLVPTFMLLVASSSAGTGLDTWRGRRTNFLLACGLSFASLGTLLIVENLLKHGVARARPVARSEHFVIAGILDHTTSSDLTSRLRAEFFECPIGRALFVNGKLSPDIKPESVFGPERKWEAEAHIRSILYREGIGPYTLDMSEEIRRVSAMAEWRPKHLEPFLTRFVDTRDVCDIDGAAPSGHVLRQGFAFFLFCSFLFGHRFHPKKMPWWLVLFGIFQLGCLIIVGWSRVYAYEHTWSDELLSLALTAGVLAVGGLVPLIVTAEKRRSVIRMSDDTKEITRINLSGDTKRSLAALAASVEKALGSEKARIYPFDPDTNQFGSSISSNLDDPDEAVDASLEYPADEGTLRSWLLLPEIRYVPALSPTLGAWSYLVAPLRAKGRDVGLLVVRYDAQVRSNQEHITRLHFFAGQAAVAVEQLRLDAEVKRQGKSLSKTLIASAGLPEILNTVVQFAADRLDTKRAVLVQDDPKLGELVVAAAHGWDKAVVGTMTLGRDKLSQAGYTVANDTWTTWNTKEKSVFSVDDRVLNSGVKSMLAVPVRQYNEHGTYKAIGALIVQSDEPMRRFSEQHVRQLESIADKTALALKAVAHHQQLQKQTAHFEALTAAAGLVLRADEKTDKSQLLAPILQAAMRSVTRTQWNSVLIGEIYDYDNEADCSNLLALDTFPPEARSELPASLWKIRRPRAEDAEGRTIGIAGRVLITGDSILESDLTGRTTKAKDYDPDWYSPFTMRSKLTVPLRNGNNIFGTICLQSDVFSAFDSLDQKNLIAFADLVVEVQHKLTLVLQLKETANKLEEDVRQREDLERHLTERNAELVEGKAKLEAAIAERSALIAYAAHASAAALWGHASIQQLAHVSSLAGTIKQSLKTPDRAALENIDRCLDDISSTIGAISSDWPTGIEVARCPLSRAFLQLETAFANCGRTLTFSSDTGVLCARIPPYILRGLLRVLINNSLEAMKESNKGDLVRIDAKSVQGGVLISVIDNGPGVEESKAGRILKETVHSKSGHGVGLLCARGAALNYGGDLQFVPVTNGARFDLTLPTC